MDAEIIAVGSELLTPATHRYQFPLPHGKTEQPGNPGAIQDHRGGLQGGPGAVFRAALARSPLIVLTGGLGPTEDDLTRDVVAEVLERPLHEVAEIRQRIEARYARLGRPMPENNLRQAQVPEGADWLENPNGTAPGIWIEHQDRS